MWLTRNFKHSLSINLEASQLVERNFVSSIHSYLRKYNLNPNDILIEITETSFIDNFNQAKEIILSLKNLGIYCALDDFGTGYSSLSYLHNLPLHTLKVDKEFIRDILSETKEIQLLSSILDIARQFDFQIIIEGIENKEQIKTLLTLDTTINCQGYYFSKPLNKDYFKFKFLNQVI